MDPALRKALAAGQGAVEAHLDAILPESDHPWLGRIVEACRYALLGGGKRLRAVMVLEGCALHGVPEGAALEAAAAIECVHAYSLVHDDLPAMDDDDVRRGRATTHKAYGEAMGILVGDALQSLAFERLAAIRGVPADRVLTLSGALARDAGVAGMVGGQHWDIAMEGAAEAQRDPRRAVAEMQALKTGALFEWSAIAGPTLAGGDSGPLRAYAHALGRAFQIADDLLDHEGDAATVGKATGKDADAGKATWVSLLGAEAARVEAHRLADAACDALSPYGAKGQTLKCLARYTVTRDR